MENSRDYSHLGEHVIKNFIQSRVKLTMDEVRAPKITWKHADGFPLSKIKERFIIPDFQRNVSPGHVNRILISILNNQFYDNILRLVIPEEDKTKMLVIDGQQRLEALWKAHHLFGLQKYDLLFGIYDSIEEARMIYQKINAGKRLKIIELMKAMDDGSIELFNKLAHYCSHDESGNRVTYYDALNGILAGRVRLPPFKAANINNITEQIASVTDAEIRKITSFLDMIYELYPDTRSPSYRAAVFRTIVHFHFRHNLKKTDLLKVTNLIMNNEKFCGQVLHKKQTDELFAYVEKHIDKIRSAGY